MAETRVVRGDRIARALQVRIGAEVRDARRAAGLSIRQVASLVGSSASELSRIERGAAPWVTVTALARVAAVVGLDLWIRVYPGGDPVRDAGHLRLAKAFRSMVGPELTASAEVPIGDGRDLRAWDYRLEGQDGRSGGVELDTRLVDVQAYARRMGRKLADGGVEVLILILADTRANRRAVEVGRPTLEGLVAIEDPAARAALAAGTLPSRNVLLFVPMADRGVTRVPPGGTTRQRSDSGGRILPRYGTSGTNGPPDGNPARS